MLPALLSENLCSLLENEERLAFCIDLNKHPISNICFTILRPSPELNNIPTVFGAKAVSLSPDDTKIKSALNNLNTNSQ